MTGCIAAIATGQSPCGVGIIRISGKNAAALAEGLFQPKSGKPLGSYADRQLVFGDIRDESGRLLDQGMAFHARGPKSYTGEDMVEIQCHGSPMVLSLLLEALFQRGARQALAGEFTKRAFLNGKLDLTQAEAVIDLIEAETPAAAKLAASQLGGSLARRVEQVYQALVDVLAHFYAVLDYPEEDIDPFRAETIEAALTESLSALQMLLAGYTRARQIRYGIPCAIIGRPNAGKSSILNLLLGYERAIVSDIPGTTRDTIEERVTLGSVLLRLIDTAGIREDADKLEQMGIERSRKALSEAELTLLVLDSSAALSPQDDALIALAKSAPACICLYNKIDLPPQLDAEKWKLQFPDFIPISARTGEGMEALAELLQARFGETELQGGGAQLGNLRQKEAAARAEAALLRGRESFLAGMPPDLVLNDVEEALQALGELSGKVIREDITARIFERFCVGK